MTAAPSLDQQIREVDREIKLRQRIYPKWVEGKRLKKHDADFRIACLVAVLKHLIQLQHQRQPRFEV